VHPFQSRLTDDGYYACRAAPERHIGNATDEDGMAPHVRRPNVRMGRLIARRSYAWNDGRRSRVVLEIGAPRRVPGWDWACPVRITGLDGHSNQPEPVFGIDALQAFELTMQYARVALSDVRPSLSWLSAVGCLGLPMMSVPGYLPAASHARIEAAVEREIKRFIARRRAAARAKARRTSKER